MVSLGKLTPSVFAATQENNAATIAINFDLAFHKTEVSPEFRPLRNSLAPYRRKAAEDGDLQFTARRLWALFQQIRPDTPNLYRAYGVRASEIANKIAIEPRTRWWAGAFTPYQGIDGGSIWAAATSEELKVLGRQEPQAFYATSSAKLSITREQLANWDASARAWLQAGDDANKLRRVQWKLNAGRLEKPVDTESNNVYNSVVSSWCHAMIAVDKLIQGAPHSITDGAILLALSSWHLFPDLLASSNLRQPVSQNDPLFVPGGILILGFEPAQILQSPDTLPFNEDIELFRGGVTWSLPLAYLRFYGEPVRKDSSLNKRESEISIAQLVQIAMGCFFHGWRENSFNAKQAAELIHVLWRHCTGSRTSSTCKGVDINLPSDRSWLGLFADAASKYLLSDSSLQNEYRKLFYWGREHCSEFLGMTGAPESSILALQQPRA
ncbi:MAG: hypothetical protein Q9228_004506 [Teloschistes exilis]